MMASPIRGAARRLRGIVSTLNKYVEDAIAATPYTPIVLIGGGISVVKGLSGMSEQRIAQAEDSSQRGEIANVQGTFGGGLRTTRTSVLSDTMKAASLIQDLVMLPLRFTAALQPLGQKANAVIDMLTDENVGLAELHEEVVMKNINNITKFTVLAVVGAGGIMVVCFLGAMIAVVLGLSMIPVFCSLLALLMLETHKFKHTPGTPVILEARLLTSPTPISYI